MSMDLKHFRDAVDQHDIVAMTDARGRITWVNEKFCSISQYSPEELIGQDHRLINSGYHPREFFRDLWTTISSGRVWHGDIRNRARDGSFYWVATTIVPFLGPDGKPAQYIAIRSDITRQKNIEDELRRLNAELERRVEARTAELKQRSSDMEELFELLPGLFLILTPDFQIRGASNAYLQATLTKREEIVGRGLFEVFPDNPDAPGSDSVANLRASLETVLRERLPHIMAIQRYDIRRPDGVFEERHWSPMNSPVLGKNGEVRYIVHRAEDVTDFVLQRSGDDTQERRLKLEQMETEIFSSSRKLQAANRLLEIANKELESFSYSVSHDLRAPLRAIDGFSLALLEDCAEELPEEGKRYLQTIRDGVGRMGQLIDDLLAFSRISRTAIQRETVNVGHLIQPILQQLQSDAGPREIEVLVEELPECWGDPALLRQIWINLLANAFKYTRGRRPARIRIGGYVLANESVYFVRDNGVGFDMKYADKLFGVFQRLHRAEEFEGTGVGLAIVQRIVQRHGGRVWAEARLEEGAAFHFSIETETNHE